MFWLIDTIIIRPIVNILFLIYSLVGDFGLAIILFTVIVKFLMWPLVKRQFHQTKLMKKIQPELAQIKKNCNGNRQMESLQMMDLYKRYNIKPFRSILTTFIQLPIFLALFMAISAVVNPQASGDTCGYTNVENCVYSPLRSFSRIDDIIEKQTSYLEQKSAGAENPVYDFEPKLFGMLDLSARAGFATVDSVIILIIALLAAYVQYYNIRHQSPSGKSNKSKKFRDLIKDAGNGKEPSQEDMNAMMSNQMAFMMPLMLLLVMLNFPGALVLYYLLTNAVTLVQQKIVFHMNTDEMDNAADKVILKELKGAKKAEVVKNKKTGTTVTRIKAKDLKKQSGKRS